MEKKKTRSKTSKSKNQMKTSTANQKLVHQNDQIETFNANQKLVHQNGCCFFNELKKWIDNEFKDVQNKIQPEDAPTLDCEAFKQCINKRDYVKAVIMLEGLSLSLYTSKDTAVISQLCKLSLSSLHFLIGNFKEISDDKLLYMFRLFCHCISMGIQHETNTQSLNMALTLHFHIMKYYYNKRDVFVFAMVQKFFVNIYLTSLYRKIRLSNDTQKLVTLSIQMSYAIYTKYFPIYIKSSNKNDLTTLFTLRIFELIMQLSNDYSKFVDDIHICIDRWTQVVAQNYMLDYEQCITMLKIICDSFRWFQRQNNNSAKNERLIPKLLVFYLQIAVKNSCKAESEWFETPNVFIGNYNFYIKNLLINMQQMKENEECSKQCNKTPKTCTVSLELCEDTVFVIDSLQLIKNTFHVSKCLRNLQRLIDLSVCIISKLKLEDIIELSDISYTKKLVSYIGWVLEGVYKQLCQPNTTKCKLQREILFASIDQFLDATKVLSSLKISSETQKDVKVIASLLNNISVHFFNSQELDLSKRCFVATIQVYEIMVQYCHDDVISSLLHEMIDKQSLLVRCLLKMEDYKSVYDCSLQFFRYLKDNWKIFSGSLVWDDEFAKKIENSINNCVKVIHKIHCRRSSTFYEDIFSNSKASEEDYLKPMQRNILCYEYNATKKYRGEFQILSKLLQMQSEVYMEGGDMLKYALVMVESATMSERSLNQRLTSCEEAIQVLEAMLEEIEDCGDLLEWHVRDVLASSYFQLGIVQYEMTLSNIASDTQKSLTEVIDDLTNDHLVNSSFSEKFSTDWCLEQDCTSSITTAFEYWLEIGIETIKLGNSDAFYHPSKSATFLYEASIFYSLMCQSNRAFKSAYLSGYIYSILGEDYLEQAVVSVAYSLQQSLYLHNYTCAEQIVSWLEHIAVSCTTNKFHADLVIADYYTKTGECEKSIPLLGELLKNEKLKAQTKTAFLLKSDIYLQCSHLKLMTSKEKTPEFTASDLHQPIKSPLPPINDCVHLLRSVYASTINDSGKIDENNCHFSASWNVLDKLLHGLSEFAGILVQQGSVLEAKAHLKEGLFISKRFQLTFWMVSFLQHLASIDLILEEQVSFERNFTLIKKILKSVEHCFDGDDLHLPEFISHVSNCSCLYCAFPWLQQIHITLYLQYIDSLNRFKKSVSHDAIEMDVMETLIENAKYRFEILSRDTYNILETFMKLEISNSFEKSELPNASVRQKNKSKTNKGKSVAVNTKPQTSIHGSPYALLRAEAKIKQPLKNMQNTQMIKTVEQVINKLESVNSDNFSYHEHQRLLAQLYCLRSLLYCGQDFIKFHLSKNINNTSTSTCEDKIDNQFEEEFMDTNKQKGRGKKQGKVNTRTKKTTRKKKQNSDAEDIDVSNNIDKETLRSADIFIENKTFKSKTAKTSRKGKFKESPNSIDIDVLTKDLERVLFLLNPYTDTLIIKSIYQLISFISNLSNKQVRVACQFLHSARILHQQLLLLHAKQLRKRKDVTKASNVENSGDNEKKHLDLTSSIIDEFSEPQYIFENEKLQSIVDKNLPKGWRLCSISLSEVNKQRFLIMSRMQVDKEPLLLRISVDEAKDEVASDNVCNLASMFDEAILEKFEELMQENKDSMLIKDKQEWWSERKRLDHQLKAFLFRVEKSYLQGWKSFLYGEYADKELTKLIHNVTSEICHRFKTSCNNNHLNENLIQVLFEGYHSARDEQLLKCLTYMTCEKDVHTLYQIFDDVVGNIEPSILRKLKECKRQHVVLILDKQLQRMPWESLPCLRTQSISRMPSLLMTISHCINNKEYLAEGMSADATFYILNPRNDLKSTQEKFLQFFKKEKWLGVTGRAPSQNEFVDALTKNNLFVYCGHGSGQEYLSWDAVQKLECKAVALLMGCSSGKLNTKGEIEAYGMVQHYLAAGSPCVVANLWDVTDRDIDLFLESLLKCWYTEKNTPITEAVLLSRDACKLSYMIGAAPVIYGLPLSLK